MENYLDKLPDVIDSVATNQFYPNLLSWLSSFIAFDNAIVYSFEKDAPPRFLSKVEKRNSDSVNRIYQRGAYLMDPFYQELQKGGGSQVLTLRELAPKGFYHTDYYLNFYRKTGWCDEVLSVVAMILMTRKYVENWLLWVIINVISIIVFYKQGVYAMSLEYLILLGIALNGSRLWVKSAKQNGSVPLS